MIRTTAILLVAATAAAHAQPDPVAARRALYAPLIAFEAAQRGIPAELADSVATVESGYDPQAAGSSGEVGLMQVLPSTAEMLGLHGTRAQLMDPAVNIHLGVQYLAGAWAATGGRLCDTLMKYRAGYGETVMSVRSIVYCQRAITYLASIGSPLASGPGTELPVVTPAMLAEASGPPGPALLTAAEKGRLRHGMRTGGDSQRFWAAEEARIRQMQARLDRRRAG